MESTAPNDLRTLAQRLSRAIRRGSYHLIWSTVQDAYRVGYADGFKVGNDEGAPAEEMASLKKDKALLDWLQAHTVYIVRHREKGNGSIKLALGDPLDLDSESSLDLRAAIDDAIKDEASTALVKFLDDPSSKERLSEAISRSMRRGTNES